MYANERMKNLALGRRQMGVYKRGLRATANWPREDLKGLCDSSDKGYNANKGKCVNANDANLVLA